MADVAKSSDLIAQYYITSEMQRSDIERMAKSSRARHERGRIRVHAHGADRQECNVRCYDYSQDLETGDSR